MEKNTAEPARNAAHIAAGGDQPKQDPLLLSEPKNATGSAEPEISEKKWADHIVGSSFNLKRERATFLKASMHPMRRILSKGWFWSAMLIILLIGVFCVGLIYYTLNPEVFRLKPLYDQPVTNTPVSLYLSIDNPDDETLTFDSSIIISGKTSPDTNVVIFSKDSATGVTASVFGEFSKVFSLNPGMNIIQVVAYDNAGNSKAEFRKVYYSQEKL